MNALNRTILVVDDDDDYRRSLSTFLEVKGYAVVEASTSEEGLRRFRAARPALAIVDLMMEEVDAGADLVKEIRALGSDAPVYMLTSVGDTMSTTTDGAALGLSGILQKPVNFEQLMGILQARLGDAG